MLESYRSCCYPIAVMTWNKSSNGIVVDTSQFRMLCWYLNTIYGKKQGSCMAKIDVRDIGIDLKEVYYWIQANFH